MPGSGHPSLGSGSSALKAVAAVAFIALFGGAGFAGVIGDNPALATLAIFVLVIGGLVAAFVVRRRRLAAGAVLGLDPVRPSIGRGERLDVRLALPTGDERAGDVEVTLRCRVSYTVRERDSDGDRVRRTRTATAWEHAVAARANQPVQTVSFELPPDAPYSYAGSIVKFRWELRALQKVRRGTDRLREATVEVLP